MSGFVYIHSRGKDSTVPGYIYYLSCPRIVLWPWTRPKDFYLGLFRELGKVDTVESVCILATSAHPAAYLAARECGREAHVLFDRPTHHAIAHGKEIAHAMWTAEYLSKQPAASQGSKRKILDNLQASHANICRVVVTSMQPNILFGFLLVLSYAAAIPTGDARAFIPRRFDDCDARH